MTTRGGQIVCARRKALGWTQTALALRLNTSGPTISRIENGERVPDDAEIEQLVSILRLRPQEASQLREAFEQDRKAKWIEEYAGPSGAVLPPAILANLMAVIGGDNPGDLETILGLLRQGGQHPFHIEISTERVERVKIMAEGSQAWIEYVQVRPLHDQVEDGSSD